MRITRTLAAALAITALGGSAAQARVADLHSPTPQQQPANIHASTATAAAKAQHVQDLRSADARDAVRNPRNVGEASTRPAQIAPATKIVAVDTDPGVDWTGIAIGAGLGLLAIAGLAGLNSHRIHRAHRPPASV
jgi:hypothetical protein